jgi:hypothetical protein
MRYPARTGLIRPTVGLRGNSTAGQPGSTADGRSQERHGLLKASRGLRERVCLLLKGESDEQRRREWRRADPDHSG